MGNGLKALGIGSGANAGAGNTRKQFIESVKVSDRKDPEQDK